LAPSLARQHHARPARRGRAYRDLLASPRWRALADAGARPQRLLWASTGTKDPDASETLYVEALAASDTIDTIPEKTLHAFADHGVIERPMAVDGGDAEAMLARFAQAGGPLTRLLRSVPDTCLGNGNSRGFDEPGQVQHDLLVGDAAVDREAHPVEQKFLHVAHHILVVRRPLHRLRRPLHVHQNQQCLFAGRQSEHFCIVPAC
jgi:hypothetical protein